jgi:hypothetical protein
MQKSHGYLYPTNSDTKESWSTVTSCHMEEVSITQNFEARNISKYHLNVQFLLTSP